MPTNNLDFKVKNGLQVSGNLSVNGDVVLNTTSSLRAPVGTTEQRPVTPSPGMIRYNSTTEGFEGYTTEWGEIGGGGGIGFLPEYINSDSLNTNYIIKRNQVTYTGDITITNHLLVLGYHYVLDDITTNVPISDLIEIDTIVNTNLMAPNGIMEIVPWATLTIGEDGVVSIPEFNYRLDV